MAAASCSSTPLAASAVACATPRMKLLKASRSSGALAATIAGGLPHARRDLTGHVGHVVRDRLVVAHLDVAGQVVDERAVVSDLAAAMNFAAAVASLKVSQNP